MQNIGLVGERRRSEVTGQNDFKVQSQDCRGSSKGVKAGNALSLTLLSQNPRRVEPWARNWEKGNSLRREAAL